MIKAKNYCNGTLTTEYLTEEFIENNREAWMDEMMSYTVRWVRIGQIQISTLNRVRTLCSRLDTTVEEAYSIASELVDNNA